MHEDPRSQSILLGVFDGHGEHGHRVSRYIERNVPAAIFKHPSWATSPKTLSPHCYQKNEIFSKADLLIRR